MDKISVIFDRVAIKLTDALSTLQGWLIGLLIMAANFFAGYHLALGGVVAAVAFDLLFGIWVALRQGRFILSELLRTTLFKLTIYLNLIVVFIFIDKFAGMGGVETKLTTMLVASAICMAETWSSCGNALIINPKLPLLRLLRKALQGEIARKLNMQPSEVEEHLTNQTKNE